MFSNRVKYETVVGDNRFGLSDTMKKIHYKFHKRFYLCYEIKPFNLFSKILKR